ncbi:MAG: lipoyl(octanoyl) transferase LipB [Dehalococcoidia bacterium]
MTNASRTPVQLHRAGAVGYERALRWQRETADRVLAARDGAFVGAPSEALAVIEHTPVYTLGRRGGHEHVLVDPAELRARGAEVIATDRGGDVTFHGPGQLVAYPILDLRRRRLGAAAYVRALEQCVIATLAALGIRGERVAGRPGVWTLPPNSPSGGRAKIAAVGVRIERGVSRHGLALNVSTDLAWFDAIVPCGIADAAVTSMAREPGGAPPFDAVVHAFCDAFAGVFDARLIAAVDPSLARPPAGGVLA